MRLVLKSNKQEVFDAPRGIGLALIQAGVVEEYHAPVVPVSNVASWELLGGIQSRAVFLRATCGRCHQGVTMEENLGFKHCGHTEFPPPAMAEQFKALTRKREPIKIKFPPPMDLSSF